MQLTVDYLIQIAKGISKQFGKHCEIVIYDVVQKDLDYAIVYLQNGHISGRKVGDGCSEGLKTFLRETPHLLQDKNAYLTKGAQGSMLKTTSTYFRDEADKIHFILEINYDISHLIALEHEIHGFTKVEKEGKPTSAINVHEILDGLLEEVVDMIGKPASLMSKDEKVKAVEYLNQAGAFLITRSGEKVAQYFNISKFTLYSYMGKDNQRPKTGAQGEDAD